MTGDVDLSRRLTDAISSVAGVSAVYRVASPVSVARSIATGLVDAARDSTGDSPNDDARDSAHDSARDDGLDDRLDDAKVAVTRTESGPLTVAATIGVEADHAVPQVLRAVGDAVRSALAAREPSEPAPVIEVRASHIDARSIGAWPVS